MFEFLFLVIRRCITWCRGNKKTVYPVRTVPVRLQGKVLLLSYFTDYMDNHLSSGVTEDYRIEPPSKATPLLRQWMRNDKIILFEMADGLLQINFFRDHYKMILYEENKVRKLIFTFFFCSCFSCYYLPVTILSFFEIIKRNSNFFFLFVTEWKTNRFSRYR